MPEGKLKDEVIHEYPACGRYRIRVLRTSVRGVTQTAIDIREYVVSETFEGFTRRGVRLPDIEHINRLRDCLADAVVRGWFDGLGVEDAKRSDG